MKKPVYRKFFARDFSLGLLEAWYWGEHTGPREWTPKQQPKHPYIVFERKPHTVECFIDESGIRWAKRELQGIIRRNPSFLTTIGMTYQQKVNALLPLLTKPRALPIPKLLAFHRSLREAWVWFEALWWTIELLEKEPKYRKQLQQLNRVRKATELMAPAADVIIRKSIAKAFPKLRNYAHVITIKEIESGTIPNTKVLQARTKHCFYTNDRVYIMNPRQLERKFSFRFKQETTSDTGIIRGQTGYPGTVTGKVRIIYSISQLASFKKGEILVAATTEPSFLPAMKEAAAFVTDEGGIVSHAAIVAREMKKPCVLGTKIATRILQDGEMVEVDATNGIITKL